jgi:hypothetical protein
MAQHLRSRTTYDKMLAIRPPQRALACISLLLLSPLCAQSQAASASVQTASAATDTSLQHVLIPDMIADPTIIESNGTFYCYATTDGYASISGGYGPGVVWTSSDFVNWSFHGCCCPTIRRTATSHPAAPSFAATRSIFSQPSTTWLRRSACRRSRVPCSIWPDRC